jgi:TRAP-type C4-dicarboxylate transport system permease small subunit
MRDVLTLVDRYVGRVETALLVLAGAAVAATVVAVTAGAFARYVLDAPIAWPSEIVTIYLGPAMTFLAISAALRDGAHVAIDVIARRLPRALMRVASVVVYAVSACFFAVIAREAADRALAAARSDDVVFGAVAWPLYAAYALVAIGTSVLVVRHVLIILATIADAEYRGPRQAAQ